MTTRMTREQLRQLPVFLLDKLYDTSCACIHDLIVKHEEAKTQVVSSVRNLPDPAPELLEQIEDLGRWQTMIDEVRREKRPALVRVLIDDPLDPEGVVANAK